MVALGTVRPDARCKAVGHCGPYKYGRSWAPPGWASLSVGMWTPLESETVLEGQFEVVGPGQCRIHPEEWRSPPLEPKTE
jgi:hypothetical protein